MKAAKQLKTKEQAEFMFDLVGVVCAGGSEQKYIDGLQDAYRKIANDAVPEFKSARAEIQEDGTPYMPWKQASALMARQMATMLKVNNGR